MKFSEKLQKLRKKNNLSQEQLADMLDVTRQSVSKWESGQTYPEMDKLIAMCKIFKCSLDDLTNDAVSDIVIEEKKKSNFTNFVDNILELISKTYNMLKTMTTKELIKCLFSMFILGIILLITKIPFDFILDKLTVIFSVIPNITIQSLLGSTFDLIFSICFFILYILIFTYIFKTAYLDKYQNKELIQEEKEEEQESNQKEEPIKQEVKNNKPRTKKNTDPFFSFLGRIIVFCVKAFVVFMTIPFVISLVLLALSFAVVFLLLFKKIIYIGVLLGIIFAIILNVLVLELVIDFIFNKQIKVKRLFITFIVGLIGLGLSAGIFCIELSSVKYIDEVPANQSSKTITELVEYENNMFIDERYSGYQTSYKTDNTLQNKIKIEITYYDKYSSPYVSKSRNDNYVTIDIHHDMSSVNDLQIDLIEKALKTKTFYNYSKLYDKKVTISASSNIITKLNQTREKYNNERTEYYNAYESSIERLENENSELQTRLEEQENKMYQLEEENEELKNKINEYKETLKSITND